MGFQKANDKKGTPERIIIFIASGLYLGFMPKAPGTWGSILGIPLYLLVSRIAPLPVDIILLLLFLLFSSWIADRAGKLFHCTDASQIVVDEVVGMWTALVGAPFSPVIIGLAFILFRFFDILKPFPIRQLEKKIPGGVGVVMDDIIAGVFANIGWHLLDHFFHIGNL